MSRADAAYLFVDFGQLFEVVFEECDLLFLSNVAIGHLVLVFVRLRLRLLRLERRGGIKGADKLASNGP